MSEKKNNEKFYGKGKVIGIEKVEGLTTPSGGEVVRIMFENGSKKIIGKMAYDKFSSDKQVDPNNHQAIKFSPVISLIIDLMTEYDIENYEVESLFKFIKDEIADRFDRASNYLWTGDDRDFIPGMDFRTFKTLLDVEKIIKSIPNKDESGGEEQK